MINGFLWIPVDMMEQVQKMMKYQEDKKQVLFKNLVFVVKPRLFSLALQFCRSPVLLVGLCQGIAEVRRAFLQRQGMTKRTLKDSFDCQDQL